MVAAPARRLLVRHMTARGLSERRALAVVGMSASSLRYQPAPDKNVALDGASLPSPTGTVATGPR